MEEKGQNLMGFEGKESPTKCMKIRGRFERDRELVSFKINPCFLGEKIGGLSEW